MNNIFYGSVLGVRYYELAADGSNDGVLDSAGHWLDGQGMLLPMILQFFQLSNTKIVLLILISSVFPLGSSIQGNPWVLSTFCLQRP